MSAAVLTALAVVLAGPAPVLLSRARWPALVPRAAVVLWQSLALAAVLAALGAGFAVTIDLIDRPDPGPVLIVTHLLAFTLTCTVGMRLVWAAGKVAVRTRTRRRRHRMLVDLLSTSDHGSDAPRLRILRDRTPIAYCVPGAWDARVVVSSGTLDQLSRTELDAVLAHEQAHLRARHDLVLEAFTMLREAFPGFTRGRTPLDQSRRLVEMLADNAARRRVGPAPLARALVTLAEAPEPAVGLAASGSATLQRVQRLAEPEHPHRVLAALTYLTAAALVIVPTLTVAIPLLARMPTLLATWLG